MKKSVRYLISIVSGIMLSLPWLGFPGWLLFAAWLPLLVLDGYYVSEQKSNKSLAFWFHAFLAFLIWNILTTWWIVHATAVGAMLAIVANSLLMSAAVWLAHLVRRKSHGIMGYIAWVTFWLTFEFFHFHWDIEWPWLTLGNGFANNVKMVQWFEYTGALGGSLWVLLVNLVLYRLLVVWLYDMKPRQVLRQAVAAALLILVPVIVSVIIYYRYEEVSDPRKILIIQPNIDPYSETFDEGALNDKLMKFLALAESGLAPDIDYIIGPETVFEQDWEESRLHDYPALTHMQYLLRGGENTSLIIGASTYKIYREGEQLSSTARHTRDGGFSYDRYNTAIFTDPSGGFQVYHKSILVPGVEKMPFRKYLRFLDRFIIDLGGTTGSLGIQPYPTNFKAPNGDLLAPVICYESVFGGYLTKFVRKGAGLVVIITNDGWWKNTPGYRQHFSFARLRAIELRRSIARSANTGISGVINQRGDIVLQTSWWKEDAVVAEVNMNQGRTFYVVYGDYIGRIAMLISGLMLLYLVSVLMRRDKKNPH